MSALKRTAQNKLDFFHVLVTLHTARLQLQLGLSSRALKTVQSCLPMILVRNITFLSDLSADCKCKEKNPKNSKNS